LQDHFEKLKAAYPGKKLLIVSNTAGATSFDKKLTLAAELEKSTGVPVLPHASKKPGCGDEIMEYFRKHPETGVSHPSQIAVVGDRLSTDMMLANMMGAWGFWVKDGVVPPEKKSIVSGLPSRLGIVSNLFVCSSRGSSGSLLLFCRLVGARLGIRRAHLNRGSGCSNQIPRELMEVYNNNTEIPPCWKINFLSQVIQIVQQSYCDAPKSEALLLSHVADRSRNEAPYPESLSRTALNVKCSHCQSV
jgi:HAD superfamily phosphatase (TIGR01668 family)